MSPGLAAERSVDWSGWYGGVNIGYGFGSNEIHLDALTSGTRGGFISPQLEAKPDGVFGGIHIGLNRQAGTFIHGFEWDMAYSGARDTVVGPLVMPGFNFQTTQSQKLDWFGTLRARAGMVVSDRSIVFLTGGLAYGRAGVSTFALRTGFVCVSPNFCVSGQSEKWLAGWTVGAGSEVMLAPNWSAKFEYLYYDLGTVSNSTVDVDLLSPPDFFRGSVQVKGNILRTGLSYKFGL